MRLLLPLLIATCCAQEHAPELPASALPAGVAETVLPAGAALHLRLASLGQALESLDRLVVPFVPPKAVPPDLRPLLDDPRPLLAFLGARTIGQPLTPAAAARISGIAADRPLTLTFYPAAPQEGFVLALPIGDRAALLGLLLNLTAATDASAIDLGGGAGLDIVPGNPALPPRIIALTSDDTLYLCGSAGVAGQLLAPAGAARLAASPAVTRAAADHAGADLALVLDAAPLKGLLPMARGFATLPPRVVAEARAALAGLDPVARAQVDLRLRLQLGIGLDALVDHAECLAAATWETLFAAITRELAGLDGLALAIDLGERDQRIALTLVSRSVAPAGWTAPIPRPAVEAGLALLPGPRDLVAITGQDPLPTPSAFAAAWVANLGAKLAAKRLPPTLGERLARFVGGQAVAPTLAARVPWSIETQVATVPAPRAADAAGLVDWALAVGGWINAGGASGVAILPGADGALLERHLREQAAAAEANAAAWRALSEPMFGAPFADRSFRVRGEAPAGGVGTVIAEDAWITRSGFFGYDQHELINRTFTRWRAHAGHLVVQRSATDPRWLAAVDLAPRPLPPALGELLALPPAEASAIVAARVNHRVIDAIDVLVEVEALAHRELDAYLARARDVEQRQRRDPAALAEALAGIEMPLLAVALERGRDGQLGCRLLGDLRYPRPAVMPLVRGLFADYAARADRVGGAVAWQRVAPGVVEWTLVQRSDALATMVRTVGDALWGTYLGDRKGQQTLQRTLSVRGDGARGGEALATNPLWAGLAER